MTATASAQSAHVQAEALFRQGKQLMAQQQFAQACTAFESSYRLEPNISTLLNHADCREKNAQLATAWGLFVDAERQTRTNLDVVSTQLNTVAAARAVKLEPQLSKLSIDVASDSQLAGLEILRGGDRVDPGAWNRSLPIDGGTYKIIARAPGHVEWSTTVVMKPEYDTQAIAIPRLDPAQAIDLEPVAARHDTPEERSRVLPIAMGGAALVLGGTAFAFSRWGDSIYADARQEPDNATQEALWRSANKRRYAAVGFGVGAASCVGAALYLYLRGDREAAQPIARRSLRIEPTATASAMGLGLRGVW
jgi:tetratricopeptide (TPR) repeat protein